MLSSISIDVLKKIECCSLPLRDSLLSEGMAVVS